jgi:hypothetical protein
MPQRAGSSEGPNLFLRLLNLSPAVSVPLANPMQPHQEFTIALALTFIDLHTRGSTPR